MCEDSGKMKIDNIQITLKKKAGRAPKIYLKPVERTLWSGTVSITKAYSNISMRRAIVESRWDSGKYTNDSFLAKRQRGEGRCIFILMDINNL